MNRVLVVLGNDRGDTRDGDRALGVTVIGVHHHRRRPAGWAIAIGIFTGASNVIPYRGFAAAMLGGLAYALLAEDIHPLIPLVTTVQLHPLAVATGVIGGAMLFGPAGMLLAIPTMTIAKVVVASSVRHLKAYGLV
jgi:predicted PurR-regulated permease PerM